jgi:iron(III) transport system substrate-binding protein
LFYHHRIRTDVHSSPEEILHVQKVRFRSPPPSCWPAAGASAQEQVLNLYSARHYSTDEALYTNFTKATGIKINRVDADDAGILARLKAEGTASPADVILLVDASRLWKGEIDGLFQPVKSKVLDAAIPAQFSAKRAADGGVAWFGFSTRARVIVYDKVKVKREDVDTYENSPIRSTRASCASAPAPIPTT